MHARGTKERREGEREGRRTRERKCADLRGRRAKSDWGARILKVGRFLLFFNADQYFIVNVCFSESRGFSRTHQNDFDFFYCTE